MVREITPLLSFTAARELWVSTTAHPQFARSLVEPFGLCGVHAGPWLTASDRGRWETSFCRWAKNQSKKSLQVQCTSIPSSTHLQNISWVSLTSTESSALCENRRLVAHKLQRKGSDLPQDCRKGLGPELPELEAAAQASYHLDSVTLPIPNGQLATNDNIVIAGSPLHRPDSSMLLSNLQTILYDMAKLTPDDMLNPPEKAKISTFAPWRSKFLARAHNTLLLSHTQEMHIVP